MPQKVLVTGATGLVGNALVNGLLKDSVNVHYLTTSKSKVRDTSHYKGFFWDPYKGVIDDRCFDGVEVIVHLAGASIAKRWTKSYKKTILESRVKTLEVILKTLKQKHYTVKHLVTASGISIYPHSLSQTYTEDSSKTSNNFLGNVVSEWEAATKPFENLGIIVSTMRMGVVLDRHQGILPQMARPIKWFLGSFMGRGNQYISWIHIDDLTAAFLFVLERRLSGTFNLVSPNPVTHLKFLKNLGKILKRPVWLHIPQWFIKLVLGEMSALLFESQRVIPKNIKSEGFDFKFKTLDYALRHLLNTI